MAQTLPSVSQVSGAGSRNTNLIASTGANINANTLEGCNIGALYIGGSPGSSPDLPPDKEKFQKELKLFLEKKYRCVRDGGSKNRPPPKFNDVYTDVDIIVEMSAEDNPVSLEIKCTDIFNSETDNSIRRVLTKGVSGAGKTICVQKFIIDWVEGKSNTDVDFIFPISFRELNKKEKTSLIGLLKEFYPDIHVSFFGPEYKTVIILDGLHEYQSSLSFKAEVFRDVKKEASVDVLLTNLVRGDLLDGAFLWITSRPVANIPLAEHVQRVTALKGFNDQQKKEYFRKICKGSDGKAEKVISFLEQSKSLRALCAVPAFCRIVSITLKTTEEEITSLTQLLAGYLFQHIQQLKQESDEAAEAKEEKVILNLGKLAWHLLQNCDKNVEKLTFSSKQLQESGIQDSEYMVLSGLCSEEVEDSDDEVIYSEERKYSFFDRCFQEFLAAVYVIATFVRDKRNPIEQTTGTKKWMAKPTMFDIHKSAVKRAIDSKGRLNIFVRSLLGLSEKSNQKFVLKCMEWIKANDASIEWDDDNNKTKSYISKKVEEKKQGDTAILVEFLSELKDKDLLNKIQKVNQKTQDHTVSQDIVITLQTNKEVQQEFEVKNFMKEEVSLPNLLPVVQITDQAKLNNCNLTEKSCAQIADSFRKYDSSVKVLDMSENELGDSGVKDIISVLHEEKCKIENLSLSYCGLTSETCESLSEALAETSRLHELNLSNNNIHDQGVFLLSMALTDPKCQLHTLRLARCQLSSKCCKDLSSSLQSADSALKHLDLSFNDLQDSGVQHLSAAPTKLETLRLACCNLTEGSGHHLGTLLQSGALRDLDLTNNMLKDSGLQQLLSVGLASQTCSLERLIIKKCEITLQDPSCCEAVLSCMKSKKGHLRELDLSYNYLQDSGAQTVIPAAVKLPCRIEKLSLACCSLTEKTCGLLSSELGGEGLIQSCLREIDFSDNDLGSSGVALLCDTLQKDACKWVKLFLSQCNIKAPRCQDLANALRKNPSHMTVLDLRFNHLEDDGAKFFKSLQTNSREIKIEGGGEFCLRKGEDRYERSLTLDENTTNPRLFLTETKIRWAEWELPLPVHLDRFDCRTQVLCVEALSSRSYWEVKWSGMASVGVAYASMGRKGENNAATLGRNDRSWCLDCSAYTYSAWHGNKETRVAQQPSGCHRLGVYLDWLGGTLAFFKVKTVGGKRKFTLLHTFRHSFSLPLLPCFRIWADSSVFICPQKGDKKAA